MSYRIGQGYDIHQLKTGRKLILGGVEIPSDKGLLGHSDADVLLHAICDAILGALGLGDIGYYFPDTDPRYKDVSSLVFLKDAYGLIRKANYEIVNVDATIVLEKPKLASYVPQMKSNISSILEVSNQNISIKATTSEKIGFIGRSEGAVALANVLLRKD